MVVMVHSRRLRGHFPVFRVVVLVAPAITAMDGRVAVVPVTQPMEVAAAEWAALVV
jgi:hypothetical protein